VPKKVPIIATNKSIEKLHDQQVSDLVKQLGNIPLSDSTLRKQAKEMNLPQFKGVLMQNSKMPEGNCTYIINIDMMGGAGLHWVAIVQQNKTSYVYDSFGRRASNLITHYTNTMKTRGYKVRNTDLSDQDQYGSRSVDCGHRCLSALKIYKTQGLAAYKRL
jgi:hypothetical protein